MKVPMILMLFILMGYMILVWILAGVTVILPLIILVEGLSYWYWLVWLFSVLFFGLLSYIAAKDSI